MTMLVLSGPHILLGVIDNPQVHLAGQSGKFKIFERRSMAAMIVFPMVVFTVGAVVLVLSVT
jgi:hypothetical protein